MTISINTEQLIGVMDPKVFKVQKGMRKVLSNQLNESKLLLIQFYPSYFNSLVDKFVIWFPRDTFYRPALLIIRLEGIESR